MLMQIFNSALKLSNILDRNLVAFNPVTKLNLQFSLSAILELDSSLKLKN